MAAAAYMWTAQRLPCRDAAWWAKDMVRPCIRPSRGRIRSRSRRMRPRSYPPGVVDGRRVPGRAHRATTPAGTTCSPPAPADANPFGSMPHPAIDPLFITTEGLTEQ